MTTKYTFEDLTNMQIELIDGARKKVREELINQKIENLDVKKNRGKGIKSQINDRRMYQWIETSYHNIEYDINFFHSEIDADSGNCHVQIGKIMFTKGYRCNKSKLTSPNEIVTDYHGKYMSDKRSTVLIFNSGNWINPIDYFPESEVHGLKKITVDDVNDGKILRNLVKAFERFIKDETSITCRSD